MIFRAVRMGIASVGIDATPGRSFDKMTTRLVNCECRSAFDLARNLFVRKLFDPPWGILRQGVHIVRGNQRRVCRE